MEAKDTTASVRDGILQAIGIVLVVVVALLFLKSVVGGIDGMWTSLVNAPAR